MKPAPGKFVWYAACPMCKQVHAYATRSLMMYHISGLVLVGHIASLGYRIPVLFVQSLPYLFVSSVADSVVLPAKAIGKGSHLTNHTTSDRISPHLFSSRYSPQCVHRPSALDWTELFCTALLCSNFTTLYCTAPLPLDARLNDPIHNPHSCNVAGSRVSCGC